MKSISRPPFEQTSRHTFPWGPGLQLPWTGLDRLLDTLLNHLSHNGEHWTWQRILWDDKASYLVYYIIYAHFTVKISRVLWNVSLCLLCRYNVFECIMKTSQPFHFQMYNWAEKKIAKGRCILSLLHTVKTVVKEWEATMDLREGELDQQLKWWELTEELN